MAIKYSELYENIVFCDYMDSRLWDLNRHNVNHMAYLLWCNVVQKSPNFHTEYIIGLFIVDMATFYGQSHQIKENMTYFIPSRYLCAFVQFYG